MWDPKVIIQVDRRIPMVKRDAANPILETIGAARFGGQNWRNRSDRSNQWKRWGWERGRGRRGRPGSGSFKTGSAGQADENQWIRGECGDFGKQQFANHGEIDCPNIWIQASIVSPSLADQDPKIGITNSYQQFWEKMLMKFLWTCATTHRIKTCLGEYFRCGNGTFQDKRCGKRQITLRTWPMPCLSCLNLISSVLLFSSKPRILHPRIASSGS